MPPADEPRIRLPSEPASHLAQWWMGVAQLLDRSMGWDKLPVWLGMPTLLGLRRRLQLENLFDTGVPDSAGLSLAQHMYRTADGIWNDCTYPTMGAEQANLGRNVRPAQWLPESGSGLLTPNPRTVSLQLLTRDRFIPATTLNMLAGAWLQFEVHDWFSHGQNETENPIVLPVAPGDQSTGEAVVIGRTRRGDAPGVFRNDDTHWWDGSQIYGSDAKRQKLVRDGARLKIEDGTIPTSLAEGFFDFDGKHAGFWTGLAALHTLFSLEHNAICDHLEKTEKHLRSDEELFQTARLVNSALLAKIHTVEWTPAIIAHPTTRTGMRMAWWGISQRLKSKRLKRAAGRVSRNEIISGIPGSSADHYGVPFSLTEEFAAVYRMHSLMPDEFVFRSPFGGGNGRRSRGLTDLLTTHAIPELRKVGMADVLYTFGISHPGALTLHNYPRTLQGLRHDGTPFDLAAVDITRDRERGVPRYNSFRQAFHKAPVRHFDQLSTCPAWGQEIRDVYDGEIDNVDLMIGLLAEPPPRGFGFSDTAFRVFMLMATRRLKSDRFFTDCYNAQHYTRSGLDWIDDNSMKTVLLRHYPRELADVLDQVDNAFLPWPATAG
ncbi:MAG: peroxidase family protein [Pseudonocardiaceae bacterium]